MDESKCSGHQPDILACSAISLAILIPCYNEQGTVRAVVENFRAALPSATIYVYDNNSSDGTLELARGAGAIVRSEPRQGKGHVVRRMFADIEADVYVLVDGDNTYEASAASKLVSYLIKEGLDFVNGARVSETARVYRPGHRFGNYILTKLVRTIFGRQFIDMLSGYKVFSRRFVKSFPAMSTGFEIETELTVHALELGMPCAEIPTMYRERPPSSPSKLRTFRDGMWILLLIAKLVRNERPLQFFGFVGSLLIVLSVALSVPILETYLETGLVPRLPTAVLSVGIAIAGMLSWLAALVLDMVTRTRQEMKRLHYLSLPRIWP